MHSERWKWKVLSPRLSLPMFNVVDFELFVFVRQHLILMDQCCDIKKIKRFLYRLSSEVERTASISVSQSVTNPERKGIFHIPHSALRFKVINIGMSPPCHPRVQNMCFHVHSPPQKIAQHVHGCTNSIHWAHSLTGLFNHSVWHAKDPLTFRPHSLLHCAFRVRQHLTFPLSASFSSVLSYAWTYLLNP